MTPVRAVFFDLGGTLIQALGDPFHQPVMARLREAFAPCKWAEDLYRADLWKRASPEDPLRQETNRWIGDWLRERGHVLSDHDVERVRLAFAAPMPPEFELTPGAADAVLWCRERGLRTAVTTNVTSRGDTETRSDCERLALPVDPLHLVVLDRMGEAAPRHVRASVGPERDSPSRRGDGRRQLRGGHRRCEARWPASHLGHAAR